MPTWAQLCVAELMRTWKKSWNSNVMIPYKRDFVTLKKSVINYLPRCSYHLLLLGPMPFFPSWHLSFLLTGSAPTYSPPTPLLSPHFHCTHYDVTIALFCREAEFKKSRRILLKIKGIAYMSNHIRFVKGKIYFHWQCNLITSSSQGHNKPERHGNN